MSKRKTLIFALLFAAITGICGGDSNKKVYVAGNGKKYHLEYCRTLQNSKHITEMTACEAEAKGYAPCKVCKPNKYEMRQ